MSVFKLLTVLLITQLIVDSAANAQIIHEEKSLYRNILVDEEKGLRCLKFTARLRNAQNQSCLDLARTDQLVFDYARMSLAGLLVQPQPERILIVGLGGGSLPNALRKLYPNSQIDNIEIDEAVIRVARRYFRYQDDQRMRVFAEDGRLFVKKARRRQQQYDFILLDAFNGEYIPEHMMTREFLSEVKTLLSPRGVLVANTFSTSELYASESVTYAAVFGSFLNVVGPERRNRIVVATAGALPSDALLARNAKTLQPALVSLGVDSSQLLQRAQRHMDWDPNARVLTDQYSPVNLLKRD